MLLAVTDAETQAKNLFDNNLHKEQQSVVVIATSGEWWVFGVMEQARPKTWSFLEDEPVLDDLKKADDLEVEATGDQGSQAGEGDSGNESEVDSDVEMRAPDSDANPWRPCPNVDIEFAEPLEEHEGNLSGTWPSAASLGWSHCMRLGTHVSNQKKFYLIHKRLSEIHNSRDNDKTCG